MPQVAGFLLGAVGFAAPAVGSAMFGGWAAGAAFAAGTFGALTVKLLSTVAASALMTALGPKPPGGGGISVPTTLHGEDKPETIIFGLTATAGQGVYVNSHGPSNRYITYVIELCSAPRAQLSRLIFDDEYVEIGATAHPDYGLPILGDPYEGRAWIKYYDGTQTTADPMLVANYGTDPDLPWTASAVGIGICYAILTFKFHAKKFAQVPRWLFEMEGVPVYDPRLDTTAGGSGPQRWATPSTWTYSESPAVIAYNIKRGYPLPGGDVWGGKIAAEDLRLSVWSAAMAKCDQAVTLAAGGTEPRYRCGIEAVLTSEPASVLVEINKAMSAEVADVGGSWTIRVGEPGLPVLWITDPDIIVSRPQEYDPFPVVAETYNGVAAQYPDPDHLWASREAPPLYNAEWEADDAFGRRVADLSLPAVPFPRQVQRLMRPWIRAERRFRRHVFALPGNAAVAEPLDTIDWSSLRNGYTGKDFELAEIIDDVRTGIQQVSLLEVDPSDYDWEPGFELPVVPGPGRTPVSLPVDGFAVQAITLAASDGRPRRVALRLSWSAELAADAVQWQIRRVGQATAEVTGSKDDVEDGWAVVAGGIVPATAYEARARLVRRGTTPWTSWLAATTADLRLTVDDLDDTTGPAVPTGLALSSALSGGKVVLTATWTAVAGSGIRYDIRIREGAGNDVPFATSGTRYTWDVLPNTSYTVAVRAVNRIGLTSAWSAEVSHTSTRDTVPPAVPAGLTALAGFETIWLKWAANTEADLALYEVYESATSTPAPGAGTAAAYSTAANTLVLTGLADNLTRHFWVRAVDTSGNKSAWSTRVQATTAPLVSADISSIIQEASYAAGLVPPIVVSALPTTGNFAGRMAFLTTDGKLYRFNGVWTRAVDGADLIANSIIAGSFQAGAIRAEDLAADSVLAKHLAVGDFTNLVPGGDLRSIGDWTFTSPGYFTLNAPSLAATQQDSFGELLFTPVSGGVAGWVRAYSKDWPVTAGDSLRLSGQAWRSTAPGTWWFRLLVTFFDKAAAPVGSTILTTQTEADAQQTTPFAVNVTVPIGAVAARFDFIADNSLTTVPIRFAAPMVRKRNGGEMVVEGSLKAVHMAAEEIITLAAQIRNAIIGNAHITDLSAAKLLAGTALAGSITVSGTALSTVESRAADPAARVNAASTQIDPGKIVISGGTSLADWRKGGDLTRIDGGALSANTVDANKLTIGNRALTLTGIEFEHNSPAANSVSWTAGAVRYTDDAGAQASSSITAGNAAWSSGILYIYWVKGATTLSTTTAQGTAFGANNVVLATYQGGTLLDADYGRTVIDGSGIKTGTITAGQLTTESAVITGSAQIASLTVDTLHLKTGSVSVYNVMGSGAVTNNSATWTTICTMTLATGSDSQSVVGSAYFKLDTTPSNYPTDFEIEAYMGGELVAEILKGTLNENPNTRLYNLPISRASVVGSSFNVTLRMRNAGGYGVSFSNVWALAEKK